MSVTIEKPVRRAQLTSLSIVTSGAVTFNILPPPLKSLAVRTKVEYAPHPYVWMTPAHALPTGLGIETEGLEVPLNELPPWEEGKIKKFPMVCSFQLSTIATGGLYMVVQVWKNPVTGALHFEVHPCGIRALHVGPLPSGASRENVLYPDGAILTDLKEIREIVYKMNRPGIAPKVRRLERHGHEGSLIICCSLFTRMTGQRRT